MKGIIMSGGKGTRLRPLTCDLPKPMVPIMNKPVMEYGIELLKEHGIGDIAVTLAYLPLSIINYFGNGEEWNVNLNYYVEDEPLGTGGSVKNAEDFLDSTFVVISGDAFTNIDLSKAIDFHKRKQSKATLVLKKEPVPLEYGVVVTDRDDRIIRFLEKPSWGEVFSDTINTGIYILEPEILDYYEKGENFDFSKDLFPRLLSDGVPMYGYIANDYWCDIGDMESYTQTQMDLLDKKIDTQIKGLEIANGVWIEEGSSIGVDAKIVPPVYIGKNCIIKNNTQIGPYTIIGDNCYIGEMNSIKRSILWNNVNMANNVQCRGTVICNDVFIDSRGDIFEKSVIGAKSLVSSNVTINPDIKIWPCKKIQESSVVNHNLIWGSKVSKNIFGNRDVSGYINIDITPEFGTKLGSAFATTLKEEGMFIASFDGTNGGKVIKDSIVSGILSTGSKVIDIKDATIPMNRFAIRQLKCDGGVHIRADYSCENKIHIELFDDRGANISRNIERKIENTLSIEDYRRSNSENLKDSISVDNFYLYYLKKGKDLLDNISKIKIKSPKVMICSIDDNILKYAEEYLTDIGCQIYKYEWENIKEDEENLSKEVIKNNLDLGIIFSDNGENIILIDDMGKVIKDEEYYFLTSIMEFEKGEISKVVIPHSFPSEIDRLAQSYNMKLKKTKTNLSDIIGSIVDENIINQYIMCFDGIWATGKIIDYIIEKDISLSTLAKRIPKFHYLKREVPCKWEDKGKVIRKIIEQWNDSKEACEGVRIQNEKGWVLILPDNEKPVFNVFIEGVKEEYADELTDTCLDRLTNLLKDTT